MSEKKNLNSDDDAESYAMQVFLDDLIMQRRTHVQISWITDFFSSSII